MILSFTPRESSEDTAGDAPARGGKDVHVSVAAIQEPRDPAAHPMYKTRAEGAAHPIYQLTEEPMRVNPVPLQASKKTEVDIATFLEALSSAFPWPRYPLIPQVLRAKPKKAARPFPSGEDEGGVLNDSSSEGALETAASAIRVEKELVEKARPVVSLDERVPLDVPYDPILDAVVFPGERAEIAAEINAARTVEAQYDPILDGAELPILRAKVVEINPVRPVEAHERPLIDAVIEPKEPVGKPRFPLQTEVPGAAQPRLSPSQRAHLRRPAVVRDCNGRLTAVTYRLNPQGLGRTEYGDDGKR